jgi:hypothetical protein
MSKASDYAKTFPPTLTLPDGWRAEVNRDGTLSVSRETDKFPFWSHMIMRPSDALTFAHWIIDTFEETP